MDRLSQLRDEAGGSRDSTLDTTSPPSEAYMSANDNTSKYFSLSDSTFDISPIKDVSLASASVDADRTISNPAELLPNMSPIRKDIMLDSYKIGKQIEAANILSGGVDIFDDNDNSFDGNELVIDDNIELDDKINSEKADLVAEDDISNPTLVDEDVASKDTEVILQIDGKNVDAIDIGNGLYLYRKDGQEELAAVQIVDGDQAQPTFKFLKVRENAEGNLEVYEEIEIAVPNQVPTKERKTGEKNAPHVPIIDINKVTSDPIGKGLERKYKSPQKDALQTTEPCHVDGEGKDTPAEIKEPNFNGKMMKISESRKSPVVGSFTPMTIHSTPNKEGKPLTKTMVDLHLDPNRHTDNVKKTIEVHTDSIKHNIVTEPLQQSLVENIKSIGAHSSNKDLFGQNDKASNNQETDAVDVEKNISKEMCEKNTSCDMKLSKALQNKSENIEETKENIGESNILNKIQSHDEKLQSGQESPKMEELPAVKDEVDYVEVVENTLTIIEREIDINPANSGALVSQNNTETAEIKHNICATKVCVTDNLVECCNSIETLKEKTVKKGDSKDIEEDTLLEINKDVKSDSDDANSENKAEIHTHKMYEADETKIQISALKDDSHIQESNSNLGIKDEKSVLHVEAPLIINHDEICSPTNPLNENVPNPQSHKPTNCSLFPNTSISPKSCIFETQPDEKKYKEKEIEIPGKMITVAPLLIEADNCVSELQTNEPQVTLPPSVYTIKNKLDIKTAVGNMVPNKNSNLDNQVITDSKPLITNIENSFCKLQDDCTSKISDQGIINIKQASKVVEEKDTDEVKSTDAISKTLLLQKPELESSEIISDSIQVPKINISDITECILSKSKLMSTDKASQESAKNIENVTDKSTDKANIIEESAITTTKSKDTEILTSDLPVPKHKSSESNPKNISIIPVPKVKSSGSIQCNTISVSKEKHTELIGTLPVPVLGADLLTNDIVIPKTKATESKYNSKPIAKIKTLDLKGSPIPVVKVKAVDLSAPAAIIPVLKLKSTELVTPSISILKVKTSDLPYPAVPVSKTQSVIKSEVKHVPVPSNVIDKPTKACETKTKLSSKNIGLEKRVKNSEKVLLKIEEAKKSNQKISNQKEAIIEKHKTTIKTTREVETESTKPINEPLANQNPVKNNHTPAVPFGKWTEVNRQEFLNKFKEVKAPVSTTSKQIKNSNDLNRRDFLKKIDNQRQQTIINNANSKAQEKLSSQNETAFSAKVVKDNKTETKVLVKKESLEVKVKQVPTKVTLKQDPPQKPAVSSTVTVNSEMILNESKLEPAPRKDLSTATMASLIDKTIDMMTRPTKLVEELTVTKVDVSKAESTVEVDLPPQIITPQKEDLKPVVDDSGTLDDIEMKMNELHGIPFVERPPHELPKVVRSEIKACSNTDIETTSNKSPKVLSVSTTKIKVVKDKVIEVDSDEEVIEHEPVTGDVDLNKIKNAKDTKDRLALAEKSSSLALSSDISNKESIITEKDFDKFARRNSITYENCLTVSFDEKEPHNVVQTIKEKDITQKPHSKCETIYNEPKTKPPYKLPLRHNIHVSKKQSSTSAPVREDSNKHYHSKIHTAYQSALTKRNVSSFTILQDKPVKVVFLESNTGFVPSQLNVQGQELSPKKQDVEPNINDNINPKESDTLETYDEIKQLDKAKTKHQRKQVFTPVEAPDIELIQPSDIGIENSPKKKKKVEENKIDKQFKNLVHKKSYLLGRNTATDEKKDNLRSETKEEINKIHAESIPERQNTASAIDSLVKAAELLDNQTVILNQSPLSINSDSQQSPPVKRGRGRPRKYPLPEAASEHKPPSPQKKPRLIDAKPIKQDSSSDDDYDDSDDEIIRENWTMGKINENIVCPICNKLFRSENVVFKHVKHCTGVSPNRSESDKSPSRRRPSQDFEDEEENERSEDANDDGPLRKSRETGEGEKIPVAIVTEKENDDIMVIDPVKEKPDKNDKEDTMLIDDTLVKQNIQKHDKEKDNQVKKLPKPKATPGLNNLCCEICGKYFRQQSYLANHKLQHKRDQRKNIEKNVQDTNKLQVFGCEVCKKQFRKLHHLVQHRIIHDLQSAPTRTLKKNSLEHNETKSNKEESASKQSEDQSAAFRCEPCDKSFRKLHHLVEHRETHDGINRQKINVPVQPPAEKPDPPPQCEICKKTFRKLQHLIDHKESHADASSDKSDDKSEKSVKSSLSTKDIIHECSSCYMVFPNEHSLNKHSSHCAKKKRQSKQSIKSIDAEIENNDDVETDKIEDKDKVTSVANFTLLDITEDKNEIIEDMEIKKGNETPGEVSSGDSFRVNPESVKKNISEVIQIEDVSEEIIISEPEVKTKESQNSPLKRNLESDTEKPIEKPTLPEKNKKIANKECKNVQETPKKKTPLKNKVPSTVTKRQKSLEASAKVDNPKPAESSDDDEIRYMLNPNFKIEDTAESKSFMKVRASKRSSLQIERTNSKEVFRRTSLQHPLKIPRLKPKAVEPKVKKVESKMKTLEPKSKPVASKLKTIEKAAPAHSLIQKRDKEDAVLSTDSEDSDVKYSFPKAPKISKQLKRSSKDEKKIPKRTPLEKRKSLVGIAKRKSLGNAAKPKANLIPATIIKKRLREVEHRCDCGKLFSSAALLARHTSADHTPPRIRRRRSPPPPPELVQPTKPDKLKTPSKKTNTKSDTAKPIRKSSVKNEAPIETRKSITEKTKRRSTATHLPVPEKIRKAAVKTKK